VTVANSLLYGTIDACNEISTLVCKVEIPNSTFVCTIINVRRTVDDDDDDDLLSLAAKG